MSNLNTVALSGNTTRDPEVRWTSEDGKSSIVSFGLAVNRRRWDKATEDYIEEVSFFDCEVFGGFAGLVAKKLKKADAIAVTGRLQQQTWETEDGKRSKIVVVVEGLDGACMYRSKDEDNDVSALGAEVVAEAETATADAAATTSEAPTADQIPF